MCQQKQFTKQNSPKKVVVSTEKLKARQAEAGKMVAAIIH